MDSFQARIIDLDNSVILPNAKAEVVPMRHRGPGLRYICTPRSRRDFEASLPASPAPLTFFGSGDFHHLSFSLIKTYTRSLYTEPFSVILFDQHPDWDITSPFPCCGSWVNEILDFPQVKRVIVLGVGAEDLQGWHLLRGNTRALRAGRLEIYPYDWATSHFWGSPRKLASARIEKQGIGSQVQWKTLKENGLDAILQSVLQRLPTSKVYISVDKDVLAPQWATSNWRTGQMSLSELQRGIQLIGAAKTIVGADVTGEWSEGTPTNPLFAAISRLDHPPTQPLSSLQRADNAMTNAALHTSFLKAFMTGDNRA